MSSPASSISSGSPPPYSDSLRSFLDQNPAPSRENIKDLFYHTEEELKTQASTTSTNSQDSALQAIAFGIKQRTALPDSAIQDLYAKTVSSNAEYPLAAAPPPPKVKTSYIPPIPRRAFPNVPLGHALFAEQLEKLIDDRKQALELQLEGYATIVPISKEEMKKLNSGNEFADCFYDTICATPKIVASTCGCPKPRPPQILTPEEVFEPVNLATTRVRRNTFGLGCATPTTLAISSIIQTLITNPIALCAVNFFSQILTLCTAGVLTYFCSGDFGGADHKGIGLLEKNFEMLIKYMKKKWKNNNNKITKLHAEGILAGGLTERQKAELTELEIKRQAIRDQSKRIYNNCDNIKNTLINIGWEEARVDLLIGDFLFTALQIAKSEEMAIEK